jgi:hypothetical protein
MDPLADGDTVTRTVEIALTGDQPGAVAHRGTCDGALLHPTPGYWVCPCGADSYRFTKREP